MTSHIGFEGRIERISVERLSFRMEIVEMGKAGYFYQIVVNKQENNVFKRTKGMQLDNIGVSICGFAYVGSTQTAIHRTRYDHHTDERREKTYLLTI